MWQFQAIYQLSTNIFLMVSLKASYFLISLLINIFVYYAFLIKTEKLPLPGILSSFSYLIKKQIYLITLQKTFELV